MYRTVENTFTSSGVGPTLGTPLFANFSLQNITVLATCTSAITATTPVLSLDFQFGDDALAQQGGNSDTAFASAATGAASILTVPVTLGASAIAVVLVGGCATGVRSNLSSAAFTAGSLKVQIAARDVP